MTEFEEEYLDVLQNIEVAIVQVFHHNPDLLDYEVEKALNALIQAYKSSEKEPRQPLPPDSPAAEVYEVVNAVCKWRLGLGSSSSENHNPLPTEIEPLRVDELLACLKRVRRSVQTWNKRAGRRGYLEFIDQYVI